MDAIQFYKLSEPFGEFSNFSPHQIVIGGRIWPTVEHYFQAQKFAGTVHEEEIRLATSPMIAARMGRSRKRPLRSDWESVKESVMRTALHAKFTQHEDLRTMLRDTGKARLVEHTSNDAYWGDGGDGTGGNRLGHLLMELREVLAEDVRLPEARL